MIKHLSILATLFAGALVVSTASAHPVRTSKGEVDDSCVVEVPSGSSVDADTGVVTDQWGHVIVNESESAAQRESCAASGKSQLKGGDDGWVTTSTAWAENLGGVSAYDGVSTSFTVPANPLTPSNAGNQLFWCGFENFPAAGGAWATVIQPEVWWTTINGVTGWFITTEALGNNSYAGGNFNYFSPWKQVASGDSLTCTAHQIASSVWQLQMLDKTSGASSALEFASYTAPFSNPYSWAQLAVLEVQNVTNCNGLSQSLSETAFTTLLTQANPAWNQPTSVLTTAPIIASAQAGGCSYTASVGSFFSSQYAILGWAD